jgi:hypothetical protein
MFWVFGARPRSSAQSSVIAPSNLARRVPKGPGRPILAKAQKRQQNQQNREMVRAPSKKVNRAPLAENQARD